MSVGIRVSEQTWPKIKEALANNAIAILPIAAECKEHGRHLPMSTDYIQAEWLVAQIISQLKSVVWPSINYGYYPAFIDYPGSCSVELNTFENLVLDILQSIVASGAKYIYVLNTGISTIQPLENVLISIGSPVNIQLVNIYHGKNFNAAEAKLKQQKIGSHADEIETSIMLAIAPETVNMELADSCLIEKLPGPFNRTQPSQPNYSPSGVYGDARLATVDKGEVLIDAILKDVLQALSNNP